jgi:hypothetical protein
MRESGSGQLLQRRHGCGLGAADRWAQAMACVLCLRHRAELRWGGR